MHILKIFFTCNSPLICCGIAPLMYDANIRRVPDICFGVELHIDSKCLRISLQYTGGSTNFPTNSATRLVW